MKEKEMSFEEFEKFNDYRQREPMASELKQERDIQVYKEYQALLKKPGVKKMTVTRYLQKKYKLGQPGSIYNIKKRVEARISRGEIKL